jgi:CheY-like chemotaxis protein
MRTVHILLVEDNEGDVLLTQEAFENAKVSNKISVVRDGQEAINFLNKEGIYSNENEPDFLLLDINLPKINGIEVLQFIKEDINLRHIPVIMLSTSCADKDIMSSYEHHANCYITKPLNVENLFNVISQIQSFWFSVAKLPFNNN